MNVAMLLYPDLTQLDLTGPFEVLHRLPGAKVHLVWKTLDPVRADSGMHILPTMTLAECPQADILMVPGGFGQIALMNDAEVLAWIARQGNAARYVTSVCVGSLLLGKAGLLKGYRATTYWAYVDLLERYGAIPCEDRVVIDRNRITGGGVSAGIDFALTLVAEIAGKEKAQQIQLAIEYDPAPPFAGGHPRSAPAAITEQVRKTLEERYRMRAKQ